MRVRFFYSSHQQFEFYSNFSILEFVFPTHLFLRESGKVTRVTRLTQLARAARFSLQTLVQADTEEALIFGLKKKGPIWQSLCGVSEKRTKGPRGTIVLSTKEEVNEAPISGTFCREIFCFYLGRRHEVNGSFWQVLRERNGSQSWDILLIENIGNLRLSFGSKAENHCPCRPRSIWPLPPCLKPTFPSDFTVSAWRQVARKLSQAAITSSKIFLLLSAKLKGQKVAGRSEGLIKVFYSTFIFRIISREANTGPPAYSDAC